MRRRYVPLAAVLGVAAAMVPTLASSAVTATINAESNSTCGYYANCWSPAQVTATSGDMVAFKNSSGVPHGVVWESGNPATPTCAGVPVNSSSTSFNGTCTFTQAGTYAFYCYVHGPSMSGRVTVNPNGTTTTTTTTTTPTGTTTTTTTPKPETPSGPLLVGRPSVRSSQRGGSVKGSLDVSAAGAGARLEIDLLAKSASLARAGHAPVRVGRLVRSSVSAGRLSFSVRLNARALRALRRHRRLKLTVTIMLTPAHGTPLTVTKSVVVHR